MADVLPPDPLTRERDSLARRLYLALLLGVPLFTLTVMDLAESGRPVVTQFGKWYFAAAGSSREPTPAEVLTRGGIALVVVQAVLATPIVFWCGAPLLAKFWRAIRTRRPDLFTLIGLGILSVLLALGGYLLVMVAWRITVTLAWRNRKKLRALRDRI
jgi:Cu+-exporting ATPase